MAGGRGAKRKLKKLRRETGEASAVVSQCLNMLSIHGIVVSFAHELPQVLQRLLDGTDAASVGQAQQGSKGSSLARLASGNAQMQPPQQAQQVPQMAPRVQAPLPPVAPLSFDELDFDIGFDADDLVGGAALPVQGYVEQGPDGQMPPISMEAMARQVDGANERMMDRLATQGVRHKHGQGPPGMQGQRMQSAEGPAVARNPLEDPMGNGAPPARQAGGGGRVNRVTGLSREEQARIISGVTGKDMDAPAASATIKPANL